MCVIHTAERAVVIWFLQEGAPSRERQLTMVRGALASAGFQPWRSTEAEVFSAGDETLLLARPGLPCARPSGVAE